uniref:Putative secreted protein n=1 Tax=Ixodes ricinus TaxID=34613 RepID=A0A6B0U0K7_IXORI
MPQATTVSASLVCLHLPSSLSPCPCTPTSTPVPIVPPIPRRSVASHQFKKKKKNSRSFSTIPHNSPVDGWPHLLQPLARETSSLKACHR